MQHSPSAALHAQADLQYRAQRQSLGNIGGAVFSEFAGRTGDRAISKRIAELSTNFPEECILVSIRRTGRLLIPHGDTVVLAGDRMTVFVNVQDVDEIEALLRGNDQDHQAYNEESNEADHVAPQSE